MHRSLCRAIRGTCRKLRDNDYPNLSGEEVRQHNRNNSKEEFTRPKHSVTEALGWTTGIILTYEFTHRRRCGPYVEDSSSASPARALQGYLQKCPFSVATKAITQPTTLTPISTVHNVRTAGENRPSRPLLTARKSIDITPFLSEKSGNETFLLKDSKYADHKRSADTEYESDDEGVHFDETISKFDEVRASKPRDAVAATFAEKVSGDLFSALGAFKFLTGDSSSKALPTTEIDTSPPLKALELLEKGAELGSSRALYNIGVAYDRMKEVQLAREYYKRAADLGHPLASYNVAVLTLKDGKISEGLTLMQFAAENGVPEARAVINKC